MHGVFARDAHGRGLFRLPVSDPRARAELRRWGIKGDKIEILEGKFTQNKPNDILSKSSREKSLTIVCKDQKIIKFSDLMLYKGKFLTEFYINNRVKTIFEQ